MNPRSLPLPLFLTLLGCALTAPAAWAKYPAPTECKTPAARTSNAARPDRRPLAEQESTPPTLANPTLETQNLYTRLKQNESLRQALFGQQHASWEGIEGQRRGFGSDIFKGLTAEVPMRPGLEPAHPAVFGWNYETYRTLAEAGSPDAPAMLARIIDTDAKGGITTIHWPVENFVVCDGKGCNDNSNQDGVDPVNFIVHNYKAFDKRCSGDKFDDLIDGLATFLQQLKRSDNQPIPVILRPFHEMNGGGGPDAHWWAGRSPADFTAMWQHLVDRLRNDHQLQNVLIAFGPRAEPLLAHGYDAYWPEGPSPDQASLRYVDIAGFDFYLQYSGKDVDAAADAVETRTLGDAIDATRSFAKDDARIVKRVVAITEVGRKDGTSIPHQDGDHLGFWMKGVKPALDGNLPQQVPGGPLKSRWEGVAYMMTWTNSASANYSIDPTADKSDAVNLDFTDWFLLDETKFMKVN
jgi:hypothetical protein